MRISNFQYNAGKRKMNVANLAHSTPTRENGLFFFFSSFMLFNLFLSFIASMLNPGKYKKKKLEEEESEEEEIEEGEEEQGVVIHHLVEEDKYIILLIYLEFKEVGLTDVSAFSVTISFNLLLTQPTELAEKLGGKFPTAFPASFHFCLTRLRG